MNDLIFNAPINSLSFGNVALNILREMYDAKLKVSFFPIGKDLEMEAFDKIDKEFRAWIVESYNTRLDGLSRDIPSIKLWHLNGSESTVGKNNVLYTFYELSDPTLIESTLASMQDKVVFSSSYASSKFEDSYYCPLGFDRDFSPTNKKY